MKKEELQEFIDKNEEIFFGAIFTFSICFYLEKGLSTPPEEIFKEWFEKYQLTTRFYGHAYRDGSIIGNSEDNITYEIIKKTKK